MAKKTLGALVDELHAIDEKIDKLNEDHNRKERVLKAQREELETKLLKQFKKDQLNGATGTRASMVRDVTPMPNIKDWDKYLGFVAKKKAWELIQKRVGLTAFREYVANGVTIPGAEVFEKVTLKTSKLKKKR